MYAHICAIIDWLHVYMLCVYVHACVYMYVDIIKKKKKKKKKKKRSFARMYVCMCVCIYVCMYVCVMYRTIWLFYVCTYVLQDCSVLNVYVRM